MLAEIPSPVCGSGASVSSPVLIWTLLLRGVPGELSETTVCSAGGGGCRKGRWRSVHTCQLLESGFHFDVFLHLRVIGMEIHQLEQID